MLLKSAPKPVVEQVLKSRISLGESRIYDTACLIKRIGRTLVLIDEEKTVPVSGKSINDLKVKILEEDKPLKIKTRGLSRAQVRRVVSELEKSSSIHVVVRKMPSENVNGTSLITHEIIVTGKNKHEIIAKDKNKHEVKW